MKMNSIITQYKKTAFLVSAVIAMSASAALFAECKPCAAAAAIKQSIKDAQAAAIAAKPVAKPAAKPNKPKRNHEIDAVNNVQTDCAFCAQNGYCAANIPCNTCQSRLLQLSLIEVATEALEAASELAQLNELDVVVDEGQARAAREALVDPCPDFPADADLNAKLQALFNCCVCTNQQLRCSTKLSEKCCKKLRHRIHDVEELIEDQTTAAADCCSLLESLAVSQIDQTATCCSVIETVLGDPAVTIASLQDCFIDVLAFVNSNDDDVLTWLKRLYVLMYQVFSCTCCPLP